MKIAIAGGAIGGMIWNSRLQWTSLRPAWMLAAWWRNRLNLPGRVDRPSRLSFCWSRSPRATARSEPRLPTALRLTRSPSCLTTAEPMPRVPAPIGAGTPRVARNARRRRASTRTRLPPPACATAPVTALPVRESIADRTCAAGAVARCRARRRPTARPEAPASRGPARSGASTVRCAPQTATARVGFARPIGSAATARAPGRAWRARRPRPEWPTERARRFARDWIRVAIAPPIPRRAAGGPAPATARAAAPFTARGPSARPLSVTAPAGSSRRGCAPRGRANPPRRMTAAWRSVTPRRGAGASAPAMQTACRAFTAIRKAPLARRKRPTERCAAPRTSAPRPTAWIGSVATARAPAFASRVSPPRPASAPTAPVPTSSTEPTPRTNVQPARASAAPTDSAAWAGAGSRPRIPPAVPRRASTRPTSRARCSRRQPGATGKARARRRRRSRARVRCAASPIGNAGPPPAAATWTASPGSIVTPGSAPRSRPSATAAPPPISAPTGSAPTRRRAMRSAARPRARSRARGARWPAPGCRPEPARLGWRTRLPSARAVAQSATTCAARD